MCGRYTVVYFVLWIRFFNHIALLGILQTLGTLLQLYLLPSKSTTYNNQQYDKLYS
jgi:hypothetical protein